MRPIFVLQKWPGVQVVNALPKLRIVGQIKLAERFDVIHFPDFREIVPCHPVSELVLHVLSILDSVAAHERTHLQIVASRITSAP